MRLLLDTHVLLWALGEPARLPSAARLAIVDTANEVFFSAASIWEIAIKSRLGRSRFEASPDEIARAAVDGGFEELPMRAAHAAVTAKLPPHHPDPFDRLLVAHALTEPSRLLTVGAARVVGRERHS